MHTHAADNAYIITFAQAAPCEIMLETHAMQNALYLKHICHLVVILLDVEILHDHVTCRMDRITLQKPRMSHAHDSHASCHYDIGDHNNSLNNLGYVTEMMVYNEGHHTNYRHSCWA